MSESHVRHTLRLVVALAASSSACSSLSECPHTVIDRTTKRGLQPNEACALAASGTNFRDEYSPDPCRTACKDSAITSCTLPNAYVTEYQSALGMADAGGKPCPTRPAGFTVEVTCVVSHTEGTATSGCPIEGRRPAGLAAAPRDPDASTLAQYFADSAYLEAASVSAFRRLARELDALGAPAALADAARRAAGEEVRHAARVGHLAHRFGASLVAPMIASADEGPRTLFDVALENAIEGVVRETFGAAIALYRAIHAADGEVRDVISTIAEEECGHAELAWDVARWASEALDETARGRIDVATAAAIDELKRDCADDAPSSLRTIAGLPSAATARAMIDGLERELWHRA